MRIIDSHMHLGDCRVFGCEITEEQLLCYLEKNDIGEAIVQPYPGATDEEEVHNRIYELTQKYPGKFYGLASVNPHMDEDVYKKKMRKYIKEYGFKAIKLHTIGHAIHPMSVDAQLVYETALDLGVAVNVHTGPGVPFSLPSLILPIARKYPEMKFILAHSGAGMYSGEAVLAAQECPNIYLEASWCSVEDVMGMIQSIGSERVMFGSDSLLNMAAGMAVFNALSLDQKQLEDVFANSAIKAFALC